MAEVRAQLNRLRIAPRKVRVVSNLIKGKDVIDAISQLEVLVKRSSPPIIKLLKSAIANAENNYNMVKENLYIKSIKVNEYVKLKRFKPKGFGRVSPIEKKTSNIEVILAEKVPGIRGSVNKQNQEKEDVLKEGKNDFKKPKVETELGKKEGILRNISKRIFRRKAI
jgi:large subunit ribosomal protein L22